MSKPATPHPQDWREGRRRRAWDLSQAGWPQYRLAEALGVSPAAVSQWLSRAIGWTSQKPIRRTSQRDEAAIAAWTEEQWPALKKRPTPGARRSSG